MPIEGGNSFRQIAGLSPAVALTGRPYFPLTMAGYLLENTATAKLMEAIKEIAKVTFGARGHHM
jgi:hypothetical protein